MADIELRKIKIDPRTGSEIVEKKVFKLNADGDPRNSIVFHQTADLLGINAFDRTDPHVYRKLALIYNWASEKINSNDPEKVSTEIGKFTKKMGINVIGNELLNAVYRKIRLETDRVESEKLYENKVKGVKEITKEFGQDVKRTQELKGEILEQGVSHKREDKIAQKGIEQATEAWKSALLKERSIKLRVIENMPSKVEEV